MEKRDLFISHLLSLLSGLFVVIIAGTQFEFSREQDFLNVRLAQNLSDGLVYNPSERALFTLSPLGIAPFGIAPDNASTIGALMMGIAIGVTSGVIFRLGRRHQFTYSEIVGIIGIWLCSAPLWWSFYSPASLALMFILLALEAQPRYLWAGFLAGLAILFHPTGAIGALLIGLTFLPQKGFSRYWLVVWIPATLWGIFALLFYESNALLLSITPPRGEDWQGGLWVFLLIGSVIALPKTEQWVWIFVAWAALEIIAAMLIHQTLGMIASLPLGLAVACGVVMGSRRLKTNLRPITIGVGVILIAVLGLGMFPKRDDSLQKDLEMGERLNIPADSTIAHDRSDALVYGIEDFAGEVYQLDGQRSPQIADWVAREDYQSLLVALAPDYLYLSDSAKHFDLNAQGISALGYILDTDNPAWLKRGVDIGEFGDTYTLDLDYGLDVKLVGYALDRSSLNAGEVVRVRLDWEMQQYPSQAMGVFINLIPPDQIPVVSIFPAFPSANWQIDKLSTYHALSISSEAKTSVLDLNVLLNYEAGILGNHNVGKLVVFGPVDETLRADNLLGTLGGIELWGARFIQENDQLRVDLLWNPTQRLEQDYRTFIHFTPVDSPFPVTQADGPPLNGRYPTSTWLSNEPFQDTFIISLYDYSSGQAQPLTAGNYVLRIGFYDPGNGQRLQGPQGDHLLIAQIQVMDDGRLAIDIP